MKKGFTVRQHLNPLEQGKDQTGLRERHIALFVCHSLCLSSDCQAFFPVPFPLEKISKV